MAGLQEVLRHWRTHVAEPDKTNIHCLILLVEIAAFGRQSLLRGDSSPS